MGYKVKLNVFEGPFDLLVYLIENAQMSIYDIKISEITKQYLEHIDKMQEMEVNVSSEFMVLAAALIEIKSKMLLPRTSPDGEDIVDEDPRAELVTKLLEYKKFKLLAEMLEQQEGEGLRIFEKPQEDISEYTDEPDEFLDLELDQFVKAFDLFLQKKQRYEEMEKNYARVEKQRVSVDTRIEDIREFFKNDDRASVYFRELLKPKSDRYDVALTFVSMLEMVRNRQVEAEQKRIFGDIKVTPTEELSKDASSSAEEETNDQ